jgi:hypothetical protein
MAVSSGLADSIDAGVIIAASGVLTVASAGSAVLLRSVREA